MPFTEKPKEQNAKILFTVFSHDIKRPRWCFKPILCMGVELFSYINAFFWCNKIFIEKQSEV